MGERTGGREEERAKGISSKLRNKEDAYVIIWKLIKPISYQVVHDAKAFSNYNIVCVDLWSMLKCHILVYIYFGKVLCVI